MWLWHQVAQLRTFNCSKGPAPANASGGEALKAPLAGNIFKVLVNEGDEVAEGEVVIIMEAMKMETEIRALKLVK